MISPTGFVESKPEYEMTAIATIMINMIIMKGFFSRKDMIFLQTF